MQSNTLLTSSPFFMNISPNSSIFIKENIFFTLLLGSRRCAAQSFQITSHTVGYKGERGNNNNHEEARMA